MDDKDRNKIEKKICGRFTEYLGCKDVKMKIKPIAPWRSVSVIKSKYENQYQVEFEHSGGRDIMGLNPDSKYPIWDLSGRPTQAYLGKPDLIKDMIKLAKESKKKDGEKPLSLEKHLTSIIGISSLILALFFLSPNLTGNAIANLTTKTSSIIGASLFIVGIVGSYFWFKKR